MKEIYIIRHGESTSNAGERTTTHDAIPLSERGELQAKELAEKLDIIPELIVISPYIRTKQTALHFINKHPDVPVETWKVQEFTYLNPKIYNGTTKEERVVAAYDYWDNASIHYRDGEGAETFFELTERMKNFIKDLETRTEKVITIFSHGRFIYGLQFYLKKVKETGRFDLTENEIEDLKNMHRMTLAKYATEKFPIDNASVHKIEI